jgi:uncharacterized repeat protein (TIGR03833 family)
MSGQLRSAVKPGAQVRIVLKADQRTGKLTAGIVKDILTNSPSHPHGIKVRLTDGQVGRVKHIDTPAGNASNSTRPSDGGGQPS